MSGWIMPFTTKMRSHRAYKLSSLQNETLEPLLQAAPPDPGTPQTLHSLKDGRAETATSSTQLHLGYMGQVSGGTQVPSKYLDQQNVTNAYVSGMKTDLGLHGNELNYITTAWTCGYVIGQIPSNLLLTRVRPSIWIPAMELIWSALTMVLASSKNFSTLVGVRFLVGLAESTFYPAIQYVIGSWYKGEELAKRACIFHTASAIGPMFSGFLQTGAYNGLNGVHGLAGWRWLFIIDGIITIPIALLGFLIMPDLPTNMKPSFLYTQDQIDMAVRRMEKAGRKPPSHFTRAKIIGFFKTWHIWLLTPLYILFNNASGPSTSMIFWLQSFNTPGHQVYSIGQINTYPLGIQAIQVVTTLIWAWWSDAMQLRWPPIIVAGTWHLVTCVVLAATPLYTHIARRWVFYYFTSVQGGLSGLILAWANELTGSDSEKRSFVVASCNTFAYVFQAWLPIVIFPQVEQPLVRKGNIATAGIDFGLICVCLMVLFMQKRDERKAAALQSDTSETESNEGQVDDDDLDSKANISVERISVTAGVAYGSASTPASQFSNVRSLRLIGHRKTVAGVCYRTSGKLRSSGGGSGVTCISRAAFGRSCSSRKPCNCVESHCSTSALTLVCARKLTAALVLVMDNLFDLNLNEPIAEHFLDLLGGLQDIPALFRTVSYRNYWINRPIAELIHACRQAIDYLADTLQLDLTLLLFVVAGWTSAEAVDDPVLQYARTVLMWSGGLPKILRNWYRPPRRHNAGISTKAGYSAVLDLAQEIVKGKINDEMRALAPITQSLPSEMNEESLLFSVEQMTKDVKRTAPLFWSILDAASCTPQQEQRNTVKSPDLSILMSISTASFNRSHHRCRFQKLMGIYFKACGTSARGLDTLSALGISMSLTWIYDGIMALSVSAKQSLRQAIELYPWTGGHDNINIRFKTYQQRLNNPTHFDSGTIGTIFIHKAPDAFLPCPLAYRDKFTIGSCNPIAPLDIILLEQSSKDRLRQQAIYSILYILKESAPFDFGTYTYKDSEIFHRPATVFQLPTGPEFATEQYILDAAHIEEASYEGNEACLDEWWRQLGITTVEQKKRIATKKDYHRWMHLLEIFGFLHALITFCRSFHHQFYGTSKSMGLRHAFDMLKRKGLAAPSTQGNFHQMLSEALKHVGEAHFWDLWCVVAGVDSLEALRELCPECLLDLANTILDDYASTEALDEQRSHPRDSQDDIFIQAILFNRDILDFLNLDDAVRTGDVGRIKDLLPSLLFRYIGGGHTNYTTEVLEMIQGFEREWPDDLILYILRFCLLANPSGNPDSFLPFDEILEHNICDIKDNFATAGPSTSWDYLKKTTGSIPTQRKVKDHVEAHINWFRRGKSHTNPDKEVDVASLQAAYARSKIHQYNPRRQLAKEDKIEDYIAKGSDYLTLHKTMNTWHEKRITKKATTENWTYGYTQDVENGNTSDVEMQMSD
ncbi:hypothetical protein NM688_g1349 [Phlebia brevispora]|uniref:Uncharacterized protein n=1 Tax=Phlebia brevispora TaxID=194682 RepID=A0ACC1TBJ6_9APHY|nr:hypothetical protein NM688_g1349 [Phlebia brevispora]